MKKRTLAADPALPTAAPAVSHSSVTPERNTKKIENFEERRLLLQVIEEAKAFRRPKRTQNFQRPAPVSR
jgi:hypothetical protein